MGEHPDAKRAAEALNDIASELRFMARAAGPGSAAKQLREFDAARCEAAAKIIADLDTEVNRLRQAIGCHHYTRSPSASELWGIARSWNQPPHYDGKWPRPGQPDTTLNSN